MKSELAIVGGPIDNDVKAGIEHHLGRAEALIREAGFSRAVAAKAAYELNQAGIQAGRGALIALAQGDHAEIKVGIHQSPGPYGSTVTVRDVYIEAGVSPQPGWKIDTRQPVRERARDLNSPQSQNLIRQHAEVTARREIVENYGPTRVEHGRGLGGVVSKVARGLGFGTGTEVYDGDDGRAEQLAKYYQAAIPAEHTARALEQFRPAEITPGAVRAEVSAIRDAEARAEFDTWRQVIDVYAPGGPREGKCLIDP